MKEYSEEPTLNSWQDKEHTLDYITFKGGEVLLPVLAEAQMSITIHKGTNAADKETSCLSMVL